MIDRGTILYIGGFELPDKNAAAHRVVNNAKAFSELGFRVIFSGITNEKDYKRLEEYKFGVSYPVPYPKSGKEWVRKLFDVSYYIKIIKNIDDIKFIITYNLQGITLHRIRQYCQKNDIIVIGDCTEWYDNPISFNPIKLVKFIDTYLCMHYEHKKLDGLIVISNYLNQYYRKYLPTVIIPPLIDLSDEKWHQEVSNVCEHVTFVYSGNPGSNKDKTKQVIDCFCTLSKDIPYQFHKYGIDKNQFLLNYPLMKSELDTRMDQIVFHGQVPHNESIKALLKYDCSIFIRDLTRKNMAGFPTKFVESYTSGINIITSAVSDIRQYFPVDEYNQIIYPNSYRNISLAIEKLLSVDVKLLRDKRRDRKHSNPFDYRNWINRLDDFFKLYD